MNATKASASALMPVEQAQAALYAVAASRVQAETVALSEAAGRVLLDTVHAAQDVPPWANSAMDGYAIHVADQHSGQALPLSQRIPAGTAPVPLLAGTAARIFTGAPLPAGANAVVMQENCEIRDSAQGPQLIIQQPVVAGENVRDQGSDVRAGCQLLPAGHRLRPADVGLLAATGVDSVRVGRRPRVALLSSGDELALPGQPLKPGQIYNSNAFVLTALLQQLGLSVMDLGAVADTRAQTEQCLLEAAAQADVIISTGGVSAGEEDHVRAALQSLGQLDIWKLAIKPGKPFAFARLNDSLFFGLPGNPVSAYVTFLILVRPALLALMGAGDAGLREWQMPAGFEGPSSGSRQEYLRVQIVDGQLRPMPDQGSGVLSSVALADGLAIVPPFSTVSRGQLLRFLPFGDIV